MKNQKKQQADKNNKNNMTFCLLCGKSQEMLLNCVDTPTCTSCRQLVKSLHAALYSHPQRDTTPGRTMEKRESGRIRNEGGENRTIRRRESLNQ
jgi:hypothetical protein